RAGSGGKAGLRAFQEAQARSGADFGGKGRTPVIPTTTPWASFNPPPFPHGLLEFCTTDAWCFEHKVRCALLVILPIGNGLTCPLNFFPSADERQFQHFAADRR